MVYALQPCAVASPSRPLMPQFLFPKSLDLEAYAILDEGQVNGQPPLTTILSWRGASSRDPICSLDACVPESGHDTLSCILSESTH
jgi:hypothetical protein